MNGISLFHMLHPFTILLNGLLKSGFLCEEWLSFYVILFV